MKIIKYAVFTAFLISLYGCKTQAETKSEHSKFLINKLSYEEQSYVLSAKGVSLYNELEKTLNYSEIPEIREYFIKALYLHKNNVEAITYLKRINEFRSRNFNRMYETALRFKNRENRTEQDNFNMCFYIQKALEISPQHVKGVKLKEEVSHEFDKLIVLYNERGRAVKNELQAVTDKNIRDELILKGLDSFGRILLISPGNKEAGAEKEYFESVIISSMKEIIAQSLSDIENRKYSSIESSIALLEKYNARVDNRMRNEIAEIRYKMNYNQAQDFLRQNNLSIARRRISTALMYRNTAEALNMQREINRRIASLTSEYRKQQDFATLNNEVNLLIKEEEFSLARDRVKELLDKAGNNQERVRITALQNEINQKIKDILPKLYQEAVSAYNSENFREAIVKFQKIIGMEPNYEQAQDYLHKAVRRQEVLDRF